MLAADAHVTSFTQHLTGDHRQRLALSRVDLAGHDRAAGLVAADALRGNRRAALSQAAVVGQLHQRHCKLLCMRCVVTAPGARATQAGNLFAALVKG